LGALAGALGGAIFGRKLARWWKERGLRAARDGLQEALAEVPGARIAALRQKQTALDARGEAVRPKGLRLWPDVAWIARGQICQHYDTWAARCGAAAVRLDHRLRAVEQGGAEARAELGRKVLQDSAGEPVFSAALQKLVRRVQELVDQVQVELRRHGLGAAQLPNEVE